MIADMKIAELLLVICNVILVTKLTSGAIILMTGVQVRSHVMQQLTVAEELATRGHQVYFAIGSRYPDMREITDKKLIPITFHIPDDVPYFCTDDINKVTAQMIFNMTEKERVDYQFTKIVKVVERDCEYMMKDESFISTVQEIKFDIAVVESFLLCPCTPILPKRLGLRFAILPAVVFPWDIRLPVLPSFYRLTSPWPLPDLKSLTNRVKNMAAFFFVKYWYLDNLDTRLLVEYANDLNSWDELIRQAELFILNRDHLLDDVLPLTPNFITLPGLTAEPAKSLPQHLQQLMSTNENGVILMTFGSLAGHIPDHIAAKFLKAFSMLKQTVLAKLKAPEGFVVPENVKLFSWVPQNDILGHRNTRLFITHCGNNGQYESIYHAVPMIGFPLFAEQPSNCQKTSDKDFAICMNIHDFSAEEFAANIEEVLSNEKYRTATRKASDILKADPMNSREKAAYWIEHVIKFGGSHLRSSQIDMPLHEFFMIDVLAVMLLVVCLLLIAICSLFS